MSKPDMSEADRMDAIVRAVADKRELVHALFNYRCQSCNSIELIGLCYGVEGPPELRAAGTWIPSPFLMQCSVCGGESHHWNFRDDAHFNPVQCGIPMRRFQVPEFGPEPERFQSVAFCGQLVGNPLVVYRGNKR